MGKQKKGWGKYAVLTASALALTLFVGTAFGQFGQMGPQMGTTPMMGGFGQGGMGGGFGSGQNFGPQMGPPQGQMGGFSSGGMGGGGQNFGPMGGGQMMGPQMGPPPGGFGSGPMGGPMDTMRGSPMGGPGMSGPMMGPPPGGSMGGPGMSGPMMGGFSFESLKMGLNANSVQGKLEEFGSICDELEEITCPDANIYIERISAAQDALDAWQEEFDALQEDMSNVRDDINDAQYDEDDETLLILQAQEKGLKAKQGELKRQFSKVNKEYKAQLSAAVKWLRGSIKTVSKVFKDQQKRARQQEINEEKQRQEENRKDNEWKNQERQMQNYNNSINYPQQPSVNPFSTNNVAPQENFAPAAPFNQSY